MGRAAVISSPPSRSTRSRSAQAASSSSADDSSSASSPSRSASGDPHPPGVGSLLASCERRCRARYARPAKENDAKRPGAAGQRPARKAAGRVLGRRSSRGRVFVLLRGAPPDARGDADRLRDPSSSYLARIPSSTTATTSAPYQRGPPEKRASTRSPFRKSSGVRSRTCTSQSSQRKPSNLFTHPRCRDVWPQCAHVARAHFSVLPWRVSGFSAASTNRPPGALHRGALQRLRIVRSSPPRSARARVRDHSSPLRRDHERAIIST